MPDLIKDETIMVAKRSYNIKNFYLDPNNYRFADEVDDDRISTENAITDKVQKRTRAFIEGEKRVNIKDLLDSFKANGFLKVDVIQIRDLGNNKYLVIEGNRRITALKCLQDDYKAGKDIGKLSPSIFASIPAEIVPIQEDPNEHLIIMGLKHISGNKKWAAINQAQLIYDYLNDTWGDAKAYAQKEDELCKSLGITKQKLRTSQRAIHLINKYKNSDYGDQFKTEMFSIFEEITKKTQIREWLEWDDDTYTPKNIYKTERLFSWISKTDKIVEDSEEDEHVERAPIIDKATEIRVLAEFINSEDALSTMERTESVSIAYQKSGIDERANIEKSLEIVDKNIKILKRYTDILEDCDLDQLSLIERGIATILPQKNAINISRKNIAYYWNSGVTSHFEEIRIDSFNKFNNLSIAGFRRINIFAGENNSGKTTILEAIYLLCNQNDMSGYFDVSKIRRKNDDVYAEYLYESMDDAIKIKGVFNNVPLNVELLKYNDPIVDKTDVYLATFKSLGKIDDMSNEMTLHCYEKGNTSVQYQMVQHLCKSYFSSPYYVNNGNLMNLYNNAVEIKHDGKTAISIILEFVRKIDPTIKNIEAQIKNDMPVFIVDSERFPEKTVELSTYGDGLVRIFEIALCFASCKNGVLLIDELETAIHFSMLVKYTKFIQELAEMFNVQVFLTTHSKECVDAFVTNKYSNEQIAAYSVRETKDGSEVIYVPGEKLERLIDLISFDLRGEDEDET